MPYNDVVYGLEVASADDVDVCTLKFMAASSVMLEEIGSWCCCMGTVRDLLISRRLTAGQSGTGAGKTSTKSLNTSAPRRTACMLHEHITLPWQIMLGEGHGLPIARTICIAMIKMTLHPIMVRHACTAAVPGQSIDAM